ncbi:uncharacterized protein IUM83_02856 [Phytophthora cinnamomi]|uniref:uncharacterized protein n=1 Tax=Phytophthora cinnamomi TaxID=4785 RepID=UPI003559FDD2|nr:hypothetical protein IUM83_02856 [Phytophthora cinnamomi]
MKFDVDDAEADMNYGRFVSPIGGASAAQRRQNSRQPRPAKIGDLHVWTLKERVQAFLDGRAGIAIETANVLLSLALVVLSIVDSYTDVGNFREEYRHYTIFEVVCTAFFAVDYALHWYAAPDRIRYMVTPMGIIDFITIVPTLLTFALTTLNLNSALPLLRIARIFRMLAVLRLYRVVQSYRGFDYQLGVLVFLILALIFVAAGVFQILEESYYTDQNLDPLQFHQAMYFVFVTLSTVGYGDISPHTTGGQFFVIFIIVVVVTVIPKQITRLIELSALQHDYMHSYSLRRRSIHNGGHVVVTGHVRLENASAFLKEFYRPRQGRVNMDVVFLADHVPSSGLQALLLNNLIFPVVLPPYFDGLVFESAAEKLYQFFHVMMIALYDQSAMRRGERSIRLCPFGERLEEHKLLQLYPCQGSCGNQDVHVNVAKIAPEGEAANAFEKAGKLRGEAKAAATAAAKATARKNWDDVITKLQSGGMLKSLDTSKTLWQTAFMKAEQAGQLKGATEAQVATITENVAQEMVKNPSKRKYIGKFLKLTFGALFTALIIIGVNAMIS